MNEGLSAGDILALTRDNDDGMNNAWNNLDENLYFLAQNVINYSTKFYLYMK